MKRYLAEVRPLSGLEHFACGGCITLYVGSPGMLRVVHKRLPESTMCRQSFARYKSGFQERMDRYAA